MGIAALLDRDATITTRLGGETESVVLRIRDGVVSPADLCVHFPIPMARAWDNVTYTCSTMLVFASAVPPPTTVWTFAAVLTRSAKAPEAASALIRFLTSREAEAAILKAGLTPLTEPSLPVRATFLIGESGNVAV